MIQASPPQDPVPEVACPDCNDFNPCTADSCDSSTGTCRHDPMNCDDQNPCTTDSCVAGNFPGAGCRHSMLPVGAACDDSMACTTADACNASGVCTGNLQPEGSSCDDGNSCTQSDSCTAAGVCAGAALTPGTSCDDASQCTSGDVCVASPSGTLCQGAVKDCSDSNLCTQDLCSPATGECSNPPVNCNDGNACTGDSCDSATGACVRTALTGSCSDGNLCTVGDFCSAGNCVGAAPNSCSDNVACTVDRCETFTQICLHTGDNSLCPAQTPCSHYVCNPSLGCRETLPNNFVAECDGNVCTGDLCFDNLCRSGGAGLPPPTGPCDDQNPCTTNDHCANNQCGGSALCDDANPCTSDSCDPATVTCGHGNLAGPCNDGNACTSGDTCSQGVCQGNPLNCDDANACTADTCAVGGGCLHTDITATCDDNNPCTSDGCDATTGCFHDSDNPSQTCGVGACQRTVDLCVGGVPQTCVPGSPTTETCNGIDDDCDGLVDENGIVADCTASPSTLNLNSQGSNFSLTCKLSNSCDPENPVPISGSTVSQVYVSRLDSADSSSDDVTLPDPSTLPCPDPVLGSLYERGISENLAARDVSNANVTFKFNLPADGQCSTLDGDRQDISARLATVPDGTSATLCIAGTSNGADFQGCVLILVRNKGLR